jgi:hypothetical protein
VGCEAPLEIAFDEALGTTLERRGTSRAGVSFKLDGLDVRTSMAKTPFGAVSSEELTRRKLRAYHGTIPWCHGSERAS